jgi:hypothetical protein
MGKNTRRLSPGRKPLDLRSRDFLARRQSTRVIRSLGSSTRAVEPVHWPFWDCKSSVLTTRPAGQDVKVRNLRFRDIIWLRIYWVHSRKCLNKYHRSSSSLCWPLPWILSQAYARFLSQAYARWPCCFVVSPGGLTSGHSCPGRLGCSLTLITSWLALTVQWSLPGAGASEIKSRHY